MYIIYIYKSLPLYMFRMSRMKEESKKARNKRNKTLKKIRKAKYKQTLLLESKNKEILQLKKKEEVLRKEVNREISCLKSQITYMQSVNKKLRYSLISSANSKTLGMKATPGKQQQRSNLAILDIKTPLSQFADSEIVDLNENLGKGQFGTVNIFLFKKLNINVALKIVELERSAIEAVIAEAKVMILLCEHKCFPYCYGLVDNNKILIQLFAEKVNGEWHKEKNLGQFVKETNLQNDCFKIILKKLLHGYIFMHKKGVLHNDIKSDNVIVTTLRNPIIIDFGKATLKSCPAIYNVAADPLKVKQYNTYHRHIAPELINTMGTSQSEATDIFSIGRMIKHLCPLVHNSENILAVARQLKVVPPTLRLSLKDAYLKL